MLIAKVENGKNTLLMELPCKRMLMADHLASIAISVPASEIKCVDEENAAIKVKIMGVSEFTGKLAALISPEDTLSLVNTVCEMYQNLPYKNKQMAEQQLLNNQMGSVRDFLRYMMEHRMEDTVARYYCPLVATLYSYDSYGNLVNTRMNMTAAIWQHMRKRSGNSSVATMPWTRITWLSISSVAILR